MATVTEQLNELEEQVTAKKSLLQAMTNPALKVGKSTLNNLTREIESAQSKIKEILANRVKLGDDTFVSDGDMVFGYHSLPTIDSKGQVVNFKLFGRRVTSTRKNLAGDGEITFDDASRKFARLNWYLATHWYSSQEDAHEGLLVAIDDRADKARKTLEEVQRIKNYIENREPTVHSDEEVASV